MRRSPMLLGIVLAGCASQVPSLAVPSRRSPPATDYVAPVEVLFDLALVCPQLSVDRGGHQFLATLSVTPEELGVSPVEPLTMAVGRRGARGASLAWHHKLGGDVRSFRLAEGRLGEGVIVAGAAIKPVPFVDAAKAKGEAGVFVLSFAPDGSLRFSRWLERSSSVMDAPRVDAVVVGPRSEVTLVGSMEEALDFGGVTVRPDDDGYSRTTAFIVQYAANGTLAFAASRAAKYRSSPRVVARPDGGVVMGFVARDGTTKLETFEPGDRGVGHRLPVTLEGWIGGLAMVGSEDVVVATQSYDADGWLTTKEVRVSRVRPRGEVAWSRAMPGQLQEDALAVTTSGVTWFGGWFDDDTTGCAYTPPAELHFSNLPRLQLIDPTGARCRSLPVVTLGTYWETPVSLLETRPGTMTFITPFAGTTLLPGVHAEADRLRPHCIAAALPTASVEYSP